MDSRAQIVADLVAWDQIANHRTGTQGDNATAQWLAEEAGKVGFEPIVEALPFTRRDIQDCSVTLGDTRIEGVPLFDGGLTGSEPIFAELGKPGDGGTIALTRFSPQASEPTTQTMMTTRKRREHPGMVTVAAGENVAPGLALINADDYSQPYGIPVLQVATEHGPLLNQALANKTKIRFSNFVTLNETTARNVQVTVPGKNAALAPLVIMTPRSAWWTCTSERGGGITIWLQCIRHFAKHPPERTVIFTANTGHELGHVGLDHYLHTNPALVKDAYIWVHLGANFAAKDGVVLIQASSSRRLEQLKAALAADNQTADRVTPVDVRPLGEARNIYDGDGCYISLLGGNPLFHHPQDRWPDAIDMPRTQALTNAMVRLAHELTSAI